MRGKKGLFVYLGIMSVLIALLLIFYNQSDVLVMSLMAVMIVITSIYTYGNRRQQ